MKENFMTTKIQERLKMVLIQELMIMKNIIILIKILFGKINLRKVLKLI
jgi:hypothetical protein